MPSGTLHAAQLPASLRAIEAVADVFHSSAREVGRRVYGHRGGLTVKERYLLAEKREALLGSTREASIQQREKQRSLRGKLVQFEKHARRMVLHASRPCDREEGGEGAHTHTIVASIASTGPLKSDSLKLGGEESRRDITAHVHGVRNTIERMNHTFIMAHARSDLFAAVRGLGGCSGKGREEGVGLSSSTRSNGEKAVILRRPPHDLQAMSPRKRHLRRRAAVCLQRHARGRPVRRLFGELTRAVLQFRGAREPPRYSSGSMGRRAMLIARLKVVSAAYERLLDILPTPPRLSVDRTPCLIGSAAASRSTSCEPPQPLKEEAPSALIRAAIAPHKNVQHVASTTPIEVVGAGGDGHGDLALGGAAAAEREFRIVLWALRNVAARLIQQEVRGYARRQLGRRWLLENSRGEAGNVGEEMTPVVLEDVTNTREASRGASCGSDASVPGAGAGSGSADGQRLRPIHVHASSFRVKGGTDEVTMPNTLTLPVGKEPAFLFRPAVARSLNASAPSTPYQEENADGVERGGVPNHVGDFFSKGTGTTTRHDRPQETRSSIFGRGIGSEGSEGGLSAGETFCNNARARDVGPPLLPSEERKRRLNEAHLRRNNSRRRHAYRSLAGLEYRGRSVLPEIIRMQRLFRAKRARRIFGEGQARQEAEHVAWREKRTMERRENVARWKQSMSRLKAVRPSALSPDSTTAGIADVVGEALHRSHELGIEGKPPKPGVPGELAEKGEPYASARWGLAVIYDLESWRGGLRQRHYFGRLLSFLGHRRRCKAALRAAVEVRMVKRLQAWTTALSEEKRSLSNSVKARAPPDVVGAHLRFLSRSGTWELLLTDLDGLLEAAFSQREHAVDLLREHCSDVLPVGQPTQRYGTARSSVLPRRQTASSASINGSKKSRRTQQASAGRPLSRDLFAGGCQLSDGRFTAGGGVTRPKVVRSELPTRGRLKEIVDEEVLARLHPGMVALLAKSGMQFVPSVPHKRRIKHRTIDASKEEVRAEAQLTRRYWKFLESVSSAISYVRAAEVEAGALAAEAGEWALLLGFAHHLTSGGFLYPPCTLPNLPRRGNKDGGFSVMGGAVGGSSRFPAPSQRHHNPAEPVQRRPRSFGGVGEEDATPHPWLGGSHKRDEAEEVITCKPQELGGAATVARWFSRNKDLCEECWAMRVGASAVGGSKCQRCGKMHRRGFAKGNAERATGSSSTRGDDSTVDAIHWQQFNQVQESLDLFVVHAAYACVLHPGCNGDGVTYGGGPGWWNGGSPEEAWWRAVCGGKRAAATMRRCGCDTIGKLYARVLTSTAASPLVLRAPSSEQAVLGDGGVGDMGSVKLLNGKNTFEGSCAGWGPTRKGTRGLGGGSQGGKLLRMVQDEGLAAKVSSLLLRLMSAFEHLRKENRWPTVSIAAVEHALRELCLPGVVGTTWTTST